MSGRQEGRFISFGIVQYKISHSSRIEIRAVKDIEIILLIVRLIRKRSSIGVIVLVVCLDLVEVRFTQHVSVQVQIIGTGRRLAHVKLVQVLIAQRMVMILTVPYKRRSVHVHATGQSALGHQTSSSNKCGHE